MCGIFGGLGVHGVPDGAFEAMARRLAHRGPDGVAFERVGRAALGLTRLAIVGTAEPARVHHGRRVAAVMNGEVYNHRALRRRVDVDGESDAAVVPALFEAMGRSFVHTLDGPFALALTEGRRLHLVRDRLGKKPLFFRVDGARAFFASEQKALVHTPGFQGRIDDAVAATFLERGYLRDDELLLAECDVVGPGEWVTLEPDGRVTRRTWWRPHAFADARRVRRPVEVVAQALEAAVQARLPDEVPWALLLSGGLDSTLLGAAAGPVPRAVCMHRAGSGDLGRARAAATVLGVPLSTHRLPAPSLEGLRRALFHLEQPESATTWSMAPAVLSLGAWLARDGVKVALLGEGADELFLGYAWDQVQAAEERGDDALPPDATRLLGPQVASLPLARSMARLFTPTPRARDVWLMAAGSRGAADDLDAGGARGLSGARRRQLAGLSHDLLTLPIPHADRLLMASGIEPRLPFLDHHLVELALSLPPTALESPAEDKPLLRAVARRWLPGVSLPPKAGFTGAAMPGPDELEALRRSMSFGQSRVLPSATFRARRGVEPLVQWRRCVLELTARVLFDGP